MLRLTSDVYDIPLPFESHWGTEETRGAVFLFAAALTDSVETALQERCRGSADTCLDDEAGGIHSMYGMMKRRYIEDFLVTNCSGTRLSDTMGAIDLGFPLQLQRKFSERALMFTEGFMKLHDTILPSEGVHIKHRLWAVRTKALDFIEELFFNFASTPVSQEFSRGDEKVHS